MDANQLAAALGDRSRWLRVVKTRTPGGAWGIAVIIDGYYASELQAAEMVEYFAESLALPAGFPFKPTPH